MRFLIFAVIAWLTSISLGGSTRSAVFSPADSKGSVPFFVTHGCSYDKSASFILRSKGREILSYPKSCHSDSSFGVFVQ